MGADDLGRKEQEYLRALRAILSVLIVCAVIALLACGHHDDGLEAGRVPHLAVELLEVQGATEVRSRASSGYDELRYRVNTPYPAPDVISAISGHLRALGYKPLKNSWFNRDDTSNYVRGWVQYIGVPAPGAKGDYICQWWADWRNDKGDVVSYILAYDSPGETLTNQNQLSVSASKMSPAMAEKARGGVTANGPVLEMPAGTAPNARTATDNSPDPHVYRARRPDAGDP